MLAGGENAGDAACAGERAKDGHERPSVMSWAVGAAGLPASPQRWIIECPDNPGEVRGGSTGNCGSPAVEADVQPGAGNPLVIPRAYRHLPSGPRRRMSSARWDISRGSPPSRGVTIIVSMPRSNAQSPQTMVSIGSNDCATSNRASAP